MYLHPICEVIACPPQVIGITHKSKAEVLPRLHAVAVPLVHTTLFRFRRFCNNSNLSGLATHISSLNGPAPLTAAVLRPLTAAENDPFGTMQQL